MKCQNMQTKYHPKIKKTASNVKDVGHVDD